MEIYKELQMGTKDPDQIKAQIYEKLECMKLENEASIRELKDEVSLEEYKYLVRTGEDGMHIWTDAFQTAIREHEYICIPAAEEPYYIDQTIIVPSNRHIEAEKRCCDPSDRHSYTPS